MSQENKERRDRLCTKIKAGENVPLQDLLWLINAFEGVEKERDALFTGWQKAQPFDPNPRQPYPNHPRDGRSKH